MYKEHQGAECINVTVTDNNAFENSITISASVKDSQTLVTIGNLSCHNEANILLEGVGADIPKKAKAVMLYHNDMCAHNTFEEPEKVIPVEIELDLTKVITIPKTAILAIRF